METKSLTEQIEELEETLKKDFNEKFVDYYYPCDKDSNGIIKKETLSKTISDWWLSKLPSLINLIRENTIERVKELIDENITINQRTHRVGSHSDDYGGDSDLPCDCDSKEREYKISELESLKIKLSTLSKGGEKE